MFQKRIRNAHCKLNNFIDASENQKFIKFAKDKNLCELLIDECPLVETQSPIVFAKNDTQNFKACCVLGLLPQQNVFISKSGQWKTDYVPAIFRTYPFSFVKTKEEKTIYIYKVTFYYDFQYYRIYDLHISLDILVLTRPFP